MAKGNATESKRRIGRGRFLLCVFLAVWMFVLGVLVGRGTAPVRFDIHALEKELSALRDAMVKKERAMVEKALRGEDEKAALEFYEALREDGPDTFTALPTDTSASGRPNDASVPHKSRSAELARKGGSLQPSASRTDPRATWPVAANTGGFTIQVASLKDPAAADRLVADLKQKGYPAHLAQITMADKGTWYRIRVGSYKNRYQAAADMDRLKRSGNKPILVQQAP